jgi:hypothetical protein
VWEDLTLSNKFYRLFRNFNAAFYAKYVNMTKRSQTATAQMLIFLLLAVHLTAELTHQHFTPKTRQAATSLVGYNQALQLKNNQPLCPACLFANQNQSFQQNIAYVVNPPSPVFVTSFPSQFFSQFQKAPCRNRAPPVDTPIS